MKHGSTRLAPPNKAFHRSWLAFWFFGVNSFVHVFWFFHVHWRWSASPVNLVVSLRLLYLLDKEIHNGTKANRQGGAGG
jgi:hypothetical protein